MPEYYWHDNSCEHLTEILILNIAMIEVWITNVFLNLVHSQRQVYSHMGIIFKLIDFKKYKSISFNLFFITYKIQRFYGKVLYMEILIWFLSGKEGSKVRAQNTQLANISLKTSLNNLRSNISRTVRRKNLLIIASRLCIAGYHIQTL